MYKDLEKKKKNNRERQKRYQAKLVAKALIKSASDLVPVVSGAELAMPVAAVPERMSELTRILRHSIDTPVTASHKIQAIEELNKMEHIYEPGQVQNVNVLFVIGKGYVEG